MKRTIEQQIERLIQDVKDDNHHYVVCPECGRQMEQGSRGLGNWECPWRDCLSATSEIPSISEIERLLQLHQDLEAIKKYKI
jgi:ribosomal protein L37AE/L43A